MLCIPSIAAPDRGGYADEGVQLKQWLSNRLKQAIAPPDLSEFGYKLLGGRLLATDQGRPAALFMYEGPKSERLSVIMHPTAAHLNSAMANMAQGTFNGCGWIDNGLGYAVVAAVPQKELRRISDQIITKQNAPPRQDEARATLHGVHIPQARGVRATSRGTFLVRCLISRHIYAGACRVIQIGRLILIRHDQVAMRRPRTEARYRRQGLRSKAIDTEGPIATL